MKRRVETVLIAGSAAFCEQLLPESRRDITDDAAFQQRLTRELKDARELQERIHRRDLPVHEYLDYRGLSRPAEEVSGDYYDLLRLPHGKLGITIGDACGKGVPAALLMAGLQSALRAQAPVMLSPAALARNLNRLLYRFSAPDRFVSLFYAVYDPVMQIFTYVNCGHNPPLVLREDSLLRLREGGPVAGLLPDVPYREATLALKAGDLIILYTDGMTEVINKEGEEWGQDRFEDAARGCLDLKAEETAARLMAAADQFVAGAPQHDDMTLMVLRVNGDILHYAASPFSAGATKEQSGNNCVTLAR